MREDRNVLDLMTADYTFLNERLAQHYGIPNVYGSHFRRVTLTDDARKGLLGKGADPDGHVARRPHVAGRARQVGARQPARARRVPPMPTNVPPLNEDAEPRRPDPDDARADGRAPRRTRSARQCHKIMDPIGLSLENFDAVGAWRTRDGDSVIGRARRSTRTGELLDGTKVDGVVTLRQALLRQPELFVGTVTEKLMIYALGRGLQLLRHAGGPRASCATAAHSNYRFSSIVMGIVNSTPFQKRVTSRTSRIQPSGRCGQLMDTSTGSRVMFITKMKLSRRTVLRGMGATLSLPLLEVDGAGADGDGQDRGQSAARFGAIFVPLGERPGYWTPKTVGTNFEFTPILKPLEAFRDHVTVVSELCDPLDGHATTVAAWLSGVDPEAHDRRKRAQRASRSIRSSPTRSARTRRSRRSSWPPKTSPAGSAAATRRTAAPT